MDMYKARGIQLGIVDGMNRGIKAFNAIRAEKQEKQRRDEEWQTDKKINELKLKKLEYELSPEKLEVERQKHKLTFNKLKADSEMSEFELKSKEESAKYSLKKNKFLLDEFNKGINGQPTSINFDAIGFGDKGMTYKAPGSVSANKQLDMQTNKNNVLKAIEMGKVPSKSMGGAPVMEEITNPDQIFAYAAQQGVDMNDPDIQKAVQKKAQGSAEKSEGSQGSDEMVLMTGPDGAKYNIPKKNVAKAKEKGFK